MRLFLTSLSLVFISLAGCSSGGVSGRADTSGENMPMAVDLSPGAMRGEAAAATAKEGEQATGDAEKEAEGAEAEKK